MSSAGRTAVTTRHYFKALHVMILFRCPYCGLETQVDDRYAGQTGPCAGCNRPVTIPAPSHGRGELDSTAEKTLAADIPARSARRLPDWLRIGFVALLVMGFVFVAVLAGRRWLSPTIQAGRQRARQITCQRNVQQIIDAVMAYHAEKGHLPPAYSVSRQGQPLHSWRVLILPYLGPEANAVYAQLDLDQPWDSPMNLRFHDRIPAVFGCPDDVGFSPGDTNYLAVTGPGFAFDKNRRVTLDDITDPLGSTVLVIESAGTNVNWMEPSDATATDLARGINSGVRGGCSSKHLGGAVTVGLADGSTRLLSSVNAPDELVRMATIQGGEAIEAIYTD